MAELRFTVVGAYESTDLVARFDAHTTVGQLADELERATDRRGDRDRTIRRLSRGETDLRRETELQRADIRNGDRLGLTLDSGVRDPGAIEPIAVLVVIAGPDLDKRFKLERGEFVVGRSSRADITLSDELASRQHAVFRLTDVLEVADAESTNGILVNGSLIDAPRHLVPDDVVEVGETAIRVETVHGDHGAVSIHENVVQFNRPPRIDAPFAPMTVKFPAPVPEPRKPRIPLISALVPLLMGGMMYLMTRNPLTVMFIAMSPLLILGNFIETRKGSAREHRAARAEYDATMHDRRADLDTAREDEIRTRNRRSPDVAELARWVADLSPRLWEREPEHTDFLTFRVGQRVQQSAIAIDVGTGGTRDQRRELDELVTEFAELPPVPWVISARDQGPLGVAGPHESASAIARSLIVQAVTLHSPNELVVGCLLSQEHEREWEWLKWLPHTSNPDALGLPSLVAIGENAGTEWAVALQQLIERRLDETQPGGEQRRFHPHLLMLIDGRIPIDRGRYSALLELGSSAGVTAVWMSPDARRLPNACRSTVAVDPGGVTITVGDVAEGSRHGSIPIESVSVDAAESLARQLAPIVDVSADRVGGSDLPSRVNLLDLVGGLDVVEKPQLLANRWKASGGSKALPGPVGTYEGGTLMVDLRVDGPHGLVGGTTGAGKSEFLQSYLAGLALNHSPERINFLLVDYKGGSAFGDLVDQFDANGACEWRGLPHTVGMITDLTPALVQRALTSLQAELHRREIILNKHRAKDLIELEMRNVPDTPASLIIVVDEFAALAKEVPAFVDGVVDIAQRGRSLGLHLLLATQKPGGVITPNIQANTNLRVALRMATEDESRDVVRSPVAGRIDRSTPGRGVIRRGPTDLVAFQSAYVGGVTTPAATAILELGELSLGRVDWLGTPSPKSVAAKQSEADLRRIVRAANAAAIETNMPPVRRPWLDPLPDHVDLLDLPRPDSDARIPFGLADLPNEQSRSVAYFDPDHDGSMLVYGMGGSGKTVFLRTLAAEFGLTRDRSPVHVYGLDFAGRGLEMIAVLPHVGNVIVPEDYERITKLLTSLRAAIDGRAAAFAESNAAHLSDFRRQQPDADVARLVVLLDGYENFVATFEKIDRGKWVEMLPRLVADGRQSGVHFVLTGTRRSSIPMAISSQVSTRLVFRMATEDEYHALGSDPKSFDNQTPAGRCLMGTTEVQTAILGPESSTVAEAREFAQLAKQLEGTGSEASAIQVLPAEVARQRLPDSGQGLRWILTDSFRSCGPDLSRNVLIAGPPRSGKTTAIASLVEAAAERGLEPEVYAFRPHELLPTARSFEDLEARLDADDTGIVFVDDAERITGTPLDAKVQKVLVDGRLIVVFAADAGHARGYDPTFKALRARCDSCVLQPNPDTDADLLGAPVERSAAAFPPGRARVRFAEAVMIGQVGHPGVGEQLRGKSR